MTSQKIKTVLVLTSICLVLLFTQAWSQNKTDSSRIKSDTIKELPDTVEIKSSSNPVNLVISEEKSDDTLTGVLIPIGTFVLGYLINYLIGVISNRKELNRSYRRWRAEISSLRSPMMNQIESLKQFISDQNDDEYTLSNPVVFAGLSCEVFKTLDKGEFLKAVQINLKGYSKDENLKEALRVCNSTLGYIEMVSANYSNFVKKTNEFLGDSGALFKEFNKNYSELFLAYRDMGIELEGKTGGQPTSIPEFNQMVLLMKKYIDPEDSPSNDIFDLEKNLFMKLDPLITSLRAYDSYPALYRFNHACVTNIRLIRQERVYLNHHINGAISNYEELLGELDDIVSLSPSKVK